MPPLIITSPDLLPGIHMPKKFASVTEQRAELLSLYREGIIDSSLLRDSLASLVRETAEQAPAREAAAPPPPPAATKSASSRRNAKKRARAKKKTAAQAPEPKERVLAAQIPAEEPLSDEEVAEMLGLNEDDDEPPPTRRLSRRV